MNKEMIIVKAKAKEKKRSSMIWIIILGLVCIVGLAISLPIIWEVIKHPEAFNDFMKQNKLLGSIAFLAMQVLQIVIAIIPGEFLEIGAGMAFGWVGGSVMVAIGMVIGTAIIFWGIRNVGRSFGDKFYSCQKLKQFERLNTNPKRDKLLFLLFLIPGLPKDVFTYGAAFFDISLYKFLIITVIARIPSIVSSTIGGGLLMEKQYGLTILIFVIASILACIGFALSDKIMKKISA